MNSLSEAKLIRGLIASANEAENPKIGGGTKRAKTNIAMFWSLQSISPLKCRRDLNSFEGAKL